MLFLPSGLFGVLQCSTQCLLEVDRPVVAEEEEAAVAVAVAVAVDGVIL
jgi:hypothetical protein